MQPRTTTPDPPLIEQLVLDDLDPHLATIHRYLARRAGAQAAEDLTADVVCSAIAGAHSYDPTRGSVIAWLMGIATNALARHWRTEQRHLDAVGRLGVDPLRSSTPASPEHHATESDEMRAVARVLSRLPDREREALLLYAWADLPYADVAGALDVPIGTVRSRIARARQRLRTELHLPEPAPPEPDLSGTDDRSDLTGGHDD